MTSNAMRVAAQIVGAWYTHCLEHEHWSFHDGAYRPASEEEYRALGEDLYAEDAPLILTRESDGTFFEVELDATAWQTSPEERQAHRDRLAAQRARIEAAAKKHEGAQA